MATVGHLGGRSNAQATNGERPERKLQQFLAFAPDAVVSASEEGVITSFNRSAEQMFGYSAAAAIGQPLTLLMPERFREAHTRGVRRFVETGEAHVVGQTVELAGQRADGSEFPLELSLTGWEVDGYVGFTGVVRDISEAKRVEHDILESRDLLQAYIDAMTTFTAKIAPDGTIVATNRVAQQASGLPPGELVGASFLEGDWWAFDPAVQARVRDAFSRALAGEIVMYEERVQVETPEGTQRLWIEFSLVPVSEEGSDEVAYVVAEGRDVTERRGAEQKFQQFLEFAPDAILGIGPEGRIVLANAQAEKVFGYSREELHGQRIEVLVPERYRDAHVGHRSHYFADPRTRPMGAGLDLYGRRKDGSEFPAEISLSSIETEEGTLATAAIRDITERKHAEQARKRLAAIIESSDDAIFDTTLEGAIVSWNPGAERIYGYAVEEVIGKPASILMLPERQNEGAEILARIKQGERVQDHETQRLRKDGTTIDVSLTVSPVKDPAGEVIGAAAIARDVTERKRAADETLRGTVVRLERSNADLEQFAYAASHDLSEPLRVITGFVQLLAKRYEGQLDERADELIQSTVAGVERMQALIDGLLAYSRVRRLELVPVQVDCSKLVQQVLEGLRRSIEERDATVTVNPLPTLAAEPVLLGQLFQNLVSNALKFTEDEIPRVELSAERDGGSWRFSVQDNGVGIEPRHTDRIFDMFQRLHSRDYEGTGIGLAICKRIVERHGGRIWVEPAPGGGTTFSFTIPDQKEVAG